MLDCSALCLRKEFMVDMNASYSVRHWIRNAAWNTKHSP